VHAERVFPKSRFALLILLLFGLFFIVIRWVPILENFWLSFQEKEPGVQRWVGLANYHRLTEDKIFLNAIKVSFSFALMAVPTTLVLGLLLAVLVNSVSNTTVRGALTASYFMAYVVPLVAVALIWRFMLLPSRTGLFNAILGKLGLPAVRWLYDERWALPSLAMVRVWKSVGYAMLILLAGLQSIPTIIYDAAKIDGANSWQRFWRVTLPLLSPTIAFVAIALSISAFQMFGETYVMTITAVDQPRGGPNYATHTLVFDIYRNAFKYYHQGYASAEAVVLFALTIIVGYVQFKYIERSYEY